MANKLCVSFNNEKLMSAFGVELKSSVSSLESSKHHVKSPGAWKNIRWQRKNYNQILSLTQHSVQDNWGQYML